MLIRSLLDSFKYATVFFSGIAFTMFLVTTFIMGYDDIVVWTTKTKLTKEQLVDRAFSQDREKLKELEERIKEYSEIDKKIKTLEQENYRLKTYNKSYTQEKENINHKLDSIKKALNLEKEQHQVTKVELSKTKINNTNLTEKLKKIEVPNQIPEKFYIGEDGYVRDPKGKPVCREVEIRKLPQATSLLVGNTRYECMVSTREYFPIDGSPPH